MEYADVLNRRRLSTSHLLSLSQPTLFFAGYDLARRGFLALYLSTDLGLSIGVVGWLVTLAGFASIPAEVIVGAIGDRGVQSIGRRTLWMVLGTALIVIAGTTLLLATPTTNVVFIAMALFMLTVGWAISNVTHGAWALESTHDGDLRGRVFGLRTLFGIAGGIGFSLIAVAQAGRVPSPFTTMLLIMTIAAPLAHALLIAALSDRRPSPQRWTGGVWIEPLRLIMANRPNRLLAILFALNGAHNAITGTGYLYLVGYALALPAWGPTGILVQTIFAAAGIAVTFRIGTRASSPRLLQVVLWANLLLAVAAIALPPRDPVFLIVWTAATGLFSAIDFMALRVLLGGRMDVDTAAEGGSARAAAYYSGFHLPFNLCGAIGAGLLFLGYQAFGFDANFAHDPEQAFVPVLFLPAMAAVALMAVSLWILAIFQSETIKAASYGEGFSAPQKRDFAEQL